MSNRRNITEVDNELLRRVASWPKHPTLDELLPSVLISCAERHGIDFATAMIYDRIRRDPKYRSFISAVEQPINGYPGRLPIQEHRQASGHQPLPFVAVVPGAFYREYPSSGADGRRVIEEAVRHGCAAELVPISGFGSPRANGQVIYDWLGKRREENIILVSLSKGAADIKFALAQPGAEMAFRPVRAWVSLSGILQGSPLSNWLVKQCLRSQLVRLHLWWYGYSFSVVRELVRGGALDEMPLELPSHMQLIHVVGFPLRHHLTNGLSRRGHRRLTPHGPNDATITLADVREWPGLIYPVWGADHYLRPVACDMDILFGRILNWLLADEACKLSLLPDELAGGGRSSYY